MTSGDDRGGGVQGGKDATAVRFNVGSESEVRDSKSEAEKAVPIAVAVGEDIR